LERGLGEGGGRRGERRGIWTINIKDNPKNRIFQFPCKIFF